MELNMLPLTHIAVASACLGLAVALAQDLGERRIPNLATIVVALSGVSAWSFEAGARGWAASVTGLVVCILVTLPAFERGWLGGGDVKLFAAAGACAALHRVLPLVLLTALAGGLVTVVYLILRRTSRGIPYALAIVGGLSLTLFLEAP